MSGCPREAAAALVLQRAQAFSVSVRCRCFGQAEVVDNWNQWLQAAGGCRAGGNRTEPGGSRAPCVNEEGWVGTGAVSGCGGLMAQEEASGSHTSARHSKSL